MYRYLSIKLFPGRLIAFLLAGFLLGACEAEKAPDTDMLPDSPQEIGSWSLVSVAVADEAGNLKADPNWEKGLLILDGEHYALQMVRPNRPAVANAAELSTEDARALLDGYRSSNGTYTTPDMEGRYSINQETGLFAARSNEWMLDIDQDRLTITTADGTYRITWNRIQSPNPMQSELVGMWRLVKAERRLDADSDFIPAFPGAKGFTVFDEFGNRIWDVSFAGRTPMSYMDALSKETALEDLRGMIQTYLVGIVRYEVDTEHKGLTQVENDGVIPGSGFRDWTYAINAQGQLEVTLANGMFRATYAPWTH